MTRARFLLLHVLALLTVPALPLRGGDDASSSAKEAEVDAAADGGFRAPLSSRNQMPLALLFVYLTPESARSLGPGSMALDLRFDYSNIILSQEAENERVYLDTEYLRYQLDFRRGFRGGLEIGASMPFLLYYGGVLDPAVGGFHDTLHLPNFLRSQTPNGLSEVDYVRGDDVVLRQRGSFGGPGDLSLHLKKTLVDRGDVALAARAILKLPTGKLAKLTGSGGTDAGFGLAVQRVGDRFALFGNANYHVLGDAEPLATKNFFSFMVGADWRFKPSLAAVIQIDRAQPALEGEVSMFNKSSQQLALGLRWRSSERFVYEWRFVEDLSSFSPDFTVAFEMNVRFPGAAASAAP